MICRSGQGRRILVNEAEKRGLWTKINSLLRLWADHQICSYKFSCNTHLRATYLVDCAIYYLHQEGYKIQIVLSKWSSERTAWKCIQANKLCRLLKGKAFVWSKKAKRFFYCQNNGVLNRLVGPELCNLVMFVRDSVGVLVIVVQ